MSDDRAELDTFVKALKNKPSPREKWEDLQVVDFRLRGYNSSEGARCILHLDCITKSSENIRLTSFSDKAVFEKLRGVKPQTVLKVSGVYKPHPGKWLAQELTRAEVIGPTDRLVKLEQSPLERARSSTGLFMSPVDVMSYSAGNEELYGGCSVCRLAMSDSGPCPVSGCPGSLSMQIRGSLIIRDNDCRLKGTVGVDVVAKLLRQPPTVLLQMVNRGLNIEAAIKQILLDKPSRYETVYYIDLSRGKQIVLIEDIRPIEDNHPPEEVSPSLEVDHIGEPHTEETEPETPTQKKKKQK
jgi:hypothetical protein